VQRSSACRRPPPAPPAALARLRNAHGTQRVAEKAVVAQCAAAQRRHGAAQRGFCSAKRKESQAQHTNRAGIETDGGGTRARAGAIHPRRLPAPHTSTAKTPVYRVVDGGIPLLKTRLPKSLRGENGAHAAVPRLARRPQWHAATEERMFASVAIGRNSR